jgi:hypothetical protein
MQYLRIGRDNPLQDTANLAQADMPTFCGFDDGGSDFATYIMVNVSVEVA